MYTDISFRNRETPGGRGYFPNCLCRLLLFFTFKIIEFTCIVTCICIRKQALHVHIHFTLAVHIPFNISLIDNFLYLTAWKA